MGRRPGSRTSHLNSWVAAAVLAAPLLVLPAAPAGATCEANHAHATLDALRIGAWRSREEGEPAGFADIDGGRWRDWTWDSVATVAGDGNARTGSQERFDPNLPLGSSFAATTGESTAPGARRLGAEQAAPMRFAGAYGTGRNARVGLFGAACGREGSLAGAVAYGVGEGGFAAAEYHGFGDSLSGVHPYVRSAPPERLSAWNVLADATDGSGDGMEDRLWPWRTAIDMGFATLDSNGSPLTSEESDGDPLSVILHVLGMQMPARAVSDAGTGSLAAVEPGRVRPPVEPM